MTKEDGKEVLTKEPWQGSIDKLKENGKEVLTKEPWQGSIGQGEWQGSLRETTLCYIKEVFKPSFHMVTHDRRITENTASDRQ